MMEYTQPHPILFGKNVRSSVILVDDLAFKFLIVTLVSYHRRVSVAVNMHKIIRMLDGNHLPA
jgi:hypothetical protein